MLLPTFAFDSIVVPYVTSLSISFPAACNARTDHCRVLVNQTANENGTLAPHMTNSTPWKMGQGSLNSRHSYCKVHYLLH